MFQDRIMLKLVILVVTLAYQCPSVFLQPNTLAVIRSSNTVADKMYEVLKTENENLLFCPVSSNILLSLVSLGAKGNTSEELKNRLQLGSDNEIKFGYRNMLKKLKYHKLKFATRLYMRNGVRVTSDFLITAIRYFRTDIRKINFKKPISAAHKINHFVEQKTNYRIRDLVHPDSLSSNNSLALISAGHFRDYWKYPFEKIFESDFYKSKNESVRALMMENIGQYYFTTSVTLGAKLIKIPFQTNHYSMVFILPNEIDGLDSVETKLGSTKIDHIFDDFIEANVQVQIPKFRIEANLNLIPTLQSMGIRSIFSNDADFSGMSTNSKLFVTLMSQKTYVDVNPFGVDAAATTELFNSQQPRSYEETFIADHPFIFAIMRDSLVLFQGRLIKV